MSRTLRLVCWLILCMLLGASGLQTGVKTVMPGPSSPEAILQNPGDALAASHGLFPTDGFLVLISLTHGELPQQSRIEKAIHALTTALTEVSSAADGFRLFKLIQTPFSEFSLQSENLRSADDRHFLLIAQGRQPIYVSGPDITLLPFLLQRWQQDFPEFSYGYLSNATGEQEVLQMISRDLDRSLVYTIPCTVLILFWAFRSFAAVLIPILIASLSLIASLGLSALLSHLCGPISATASQLVVLLVLAIGVDYSLFFITRAREELRKGATVEECIHTARTTTGHAIFWCGIIVSVSLSGMFIMQDTVLRSMALVAIVAVMVTLASCLLALPALTSLFPSSIMSNPRRNRTSDSYLWTRLSLKFPVTALLLVSGVLAICGAFTSTMQLGNTMTPQILPRTLQSMRTLDQIKQHFPSLTGGAITLTLSGDSLDQREQNGELEPLWQQLNQMGLRGPTRSEVSEDLEVQRYYFLSNGDGNDRSTRALLGQLKNQWLAETFHPLGIEAFLSGAVPYGQNEAERYAHRFPLVLAVVLALSFVSLLIAFKSLVIPLKAIILNLLSTVASFGGLVIVFQMFPESPFYHGVIESFVPPLLFTILFGLSMDYHIFVLARITEEFRRYGDTALAVQVGISQTSKTITAAALIMISVFLVAATLELPVMKQLGIGLAAAVLIDATLIRSILLPASMVLLGRFNWYFPGRSSHRT